MLEAEVAKSKDYVAVILKKGAGLSKSPPERKLTSSAKAESISGSLVTIVFATGYDPVEAGFVARLNRPDGNATAVTVNAGPLGGIIFAAQQDRHTLHRHHEAEAPLHH